MAQILINPIYLGLAAAATYTLTQIQELLRKYPIRRNINSSHILDKEQHDFNEECGEECIFFVSEKIKAKLKVDLTKDKIPVPNVTSRDLCKHGCTIEVRLGLSTTKEWKIDTAYHPIDMPCLVKGKK